MHALPSHPRNPLVAGVVALLLALVVMLAAAPELGTLDLSIGGGGGSAADTYVPPAADPVATEAPAPTWTTDPLAPPVERLR